MCIAPNMQVDTPSMQLDGNQQESLPSSEILSGTDFEMEFPFPSSTGSWDILSTRPSMDPHLEEMPEICDGPAPLSMSTLETP
jgi:hypothetical protein